MTDDSGRILAAVARVETEIKNLSDDLTGLESRTGKLEKIAYVALGMAISSGLPAVIEAFKVTGAAG